MPGGQQGTGVAIPSTGRLGGIDGLRACAVLVVIAAHSLVSFTPGGLVGVDVFFGISGFLITHLLLRERERFGSISLRGFWLRRALRLLPALLAVVVVVDLFAALYSVAGVGMLHLKAEEEIGQVLPATPAVLLYYANWMLVATRSTWLGWFGPMWSLSVEEQFYLVWPIVLVVVMKSRARLGLLAGIAGVVCVLANVWRFTTFDGSDLYATFNTLFRVDMMLLGVLLAIGLRTSLSAWVVRVTRWAVWPAIVWLVLVVALMPQWGARGADSAVRLYYVVGLPLVGLATFTIVGFLATHQGARLTGALQRPPLAHLGRISYGMYLWHYPIVHALFHTRMPPVLVFLTGTALTVAVASCSWALLERPLHRRFHEVLRPEELHRARTVPPGEPALA